ncbi:MAG TPA: hypothetical protein VJH22_03885 [Candidatus Nanoarchaeia archaeon]|nr:hypothetical protein [Candidatus Nanoarchaeia archaeon]
MAKPIIIVLIVALVALVGLLLSNDTNSLSGQATSKRAIIDENFRPPLGSIAIINGQSRVAIIDENQVAIIDENMPRSAGHSGGTWIDRRGRRGIIDPLFVPQRGQLMLIGDDGAVSIIDENRVAIIDENMPRK